MKKHSLILLLIVFSACAQGKLTNTKALEALQEKYKNPCSQSVIGAFFKNENNYSNFLKEANKLEQEGYVTLKHKLLPTAPGQAVHKTFLNVTKKGDNEFQLSKGGWGSSSKYVVANAKVVKILGISQNNLEATVRFSYVYEPNELYPIRRFAFPKNNRGTDCAKGEQEAEVTFKKFDTGWVMQKPKTEEEIYLELLKKGK